MDKISALDAATRFAHMVKAKYEFAKVLLFGSFAKGNYSENSDIDVAVVLNEFNNLSELQLELMRLRRSIDSRIEPHPFRLTDFTRSNPLVDEILKHGVEIF